MEKEEYQKLSRKEKNTIKYKDLPKSIKKTQIILGIIFLICFTTCVGMNIGGDSNKKNEKREINTSDLSYYSKVMAKKFVKKVLKAPSTAKFPEEEIHIGLNPDSTVIIKLAVDAQNSYGAMIRANYYLKMKWSNDYEVPSNWQILDIQDESE